MFVFVGIFWMVVMVLWSVIVGCRFRLDEVWFLNGDSL